MYQVYDFFFTDHVVIELTLMKYQFIVKYQISITDANETLRLYVLTIVHDQRRIAAAYANIIIEHDKS